MTKTVCKALSLVALVGAVGCTADGTPGLELEPIDGGAVDAELALAPRGFPPPPCITIPCPPPPPPPPDPSTYLPQCTSAIDAALASYSSTLRSALGTDVSLGVVPIYTTHGAACYHEYSNGSIEWSAASGAFEVHGAIYAKWASLGYEEAYVGMPTTNESDAVGGRFNHFTNGSIYWNGSTAFAVQRPIETKWSSLGWERGRVGMPTSDTTPTPNGLGSYNHFTGGSIYTSAAGTFFVTGAIRDRWAATGWEAGFLGFPTSDEIGGQPACKQPGCGSGAVSHFQHGSIYWAPSASVGAHTVSADLEPTWLAEGGPSGCHGYPIGEPSGNPATQSFEGGTFSYTPGVGGSAHANGACCGLSGSACCSGSSYVCSSGLSCQGGTCAVPPACGANGQSCCGGSSCNSGLSCQSGTCRPACGAGGQACCGGTTCNNSNLACVSGTCRDCGTIAGNVCCAGNDCHNANLMCVPNAVSPSGPNLCAQCGVFNTRCCPGSGCASGLVCRQSLFDSQYYCTTPS